MTGNRIWIFGLGLLVFGWLLFSQAAGTAEEEEIAPYMGELQRFSQKLGYAVNAENLRLAEFYRHEVDEVLDHLETIKEHDGFPIGGSIRKIMTPLMGEFQSALHQQSWPAIKKGYLGLIDGCNRCHAATEHEFLIITPATGEPPFNQQF